MLCFYCFAISDFTLKVDVAIACYCSVLQVIPFFMLLFFVLVPCFVFQVYLKMWLKTDLQCFAFFKKNVIVEASELRSLQVFFVLDLMYEF